MVELAPGSAASAPSPGKCTALRQKMPGLCSTRHWIVFDAIDKSNSRDPTRKHYYSRGNAIGCGTISGVTIACFGKCAHGFQFGLSRATQPANQFLGTQ